MNSYFSSSSESEEYYEAPKARGPRGGAASAHSRNPSTGDSSSGRTPDDRELEDRYELLEGVQEGLEDLRAAYETILAAAKALEAAGRAELPPWLRCMLAVETRPVLGDVVEAVARASDAVGEERQRLLGGGEGEGGRPLKVARLYLSTMRLYHTKCAKRFDEAARLLGDKSRSASARLPAAALPADPFEDSEEEAPPPPAAESPPPAAARAGPPPVPLRRSAPPRSSRAAAPEEDPFGEQPLADLAAARERTRSRAPQPSSAPSSPRKGGGGPPDEGGGADSFIIIRERAPSTAEAVNPSLRETGSFAAPPPFSNSLKESGLFTRPDTETISRPRLESQSSLPVVSPRARASNVATIGRKGRSPAPTLTSAAAPGGGGGGSAPLKEVPLALEWGSDKRPLKVLSRTGDFEPPADDVLKFEVSRKAGLLLSANFSISVTGGADPSLSIYDVKAQTSQTRSLSNVLKVTRSNKHHRKLKIWWRGEPVERFLFKSGRERERFVEAVWSYRGMVPEPQLYAEPIEIFIGTFNLGDAMPPQNMDEWLQPNQYDVYVVSAQEAGYDLEKGQGSNAEQHFYSLVEAALGPDYVRVAQLSLLHIRMCVYVAKRHSHKVSNVRKATVATGIGNVIGNKGGCFVSFSFNETSLCFVGCHLAAREERYEQRCTNVQQILQGISASQPPGLGPDTWFDYMFWTGDLNYRLTAERELVCQLAKDGNVEQLLESDQLLKARRERKAFDQWTEPPITFSPSYRYDRGSSTFSEEKMRTPSYCDRVLFRSKPGTSPVVSAYDCVHSITTSDHHPVYATMVLDTLLTGIIHERVPCYIEITDLAGRDLSFVSADREAPFVAFYSNFTKPNKQTKRSVLKGSNSRWDDSGVPKLKPFFSSRALLGLSHLSLAVRDGKNEVAQGVLALCDAVGPSPAEFCIPLTNGGLPAGELRGKVHVKWRKEEDSAASGASGAAGRLALKKSAAGMGKGTVLKMGYMLKQGSRVKSWKRRWFVFESTGELAYYADPKSPKYLDKLHVDRVSAHPGAGKQNCLAVDTGKRKLLFCADNAADYDSWMKVLQAYCDAKAAADE